MMNRFEYCRPASIADAVGVLAASQGCARVMAGGTDLNVALRDGILPKCPELIVDLQGIAELGGIEEQGPMLRIGAMTTLAEIAASDVIRVRFGALAAAAGQVATPQIRNIGTIAGNLCQENRCWYYRYPHSIGGRIDCKRKGGKKCFAAAGDCRGHSIFGAVAGCLAVNPGDVAPVLVVLDAAVVTTRRTVAVAALFAADRGMPSTILDADEFITQVLIPAPPAGRRTAFKKIAVRKSMDFAILNCAAGLAVRDSVIGDVRICLNAVHGNPFRAQGAEQILAGQSLTPELAALAGRAAVETARPLPANRYKVKMASDLVSDVLLLAGSDDR